MDFPTFLLRLLSEDWVFFLENEIQWDGKHHRITGIQINGAKADELPLFIENETEGFDGLDEVLTYFIGFLSEAEKDDDLIVPRSAIAPELYGMMGEGDLTAITLANLAAYASAFQVVNTEPDSYVILFDPRLSDGIPQFFNLVARLLWDYRIHLQSLNGKPFDVMFMGARNFDIDQFIPQEVPRVPGAQDNPVAMHVEEIPRIDLDSDDAYGQDSGNSSMLMLDEMLEADLYGLLNSIPYELSIEGTHHQGRAERIERVRVGDSLTLRSDWDNEFYSPAAIEVFNSEGSLGYLSEGLSMPGYGHTALASLLPHVKATVASVTPLSQRNANAKYALMDVRIELDEEVSPYDGSRERFIDEAKKVLAKPESERDAESINEIVSIAVQPEVSESGAHDDQEDSAARERIAELEEKEKGLAGESKKAFDAIACSGGNIALMDIMQRADLGWDLESFYDYTMESLMRRGLVIERMESERGKGPETRCKRFYTWRQVDSEG